MMENTLVVSWSAMPFTKTASAFLAEDLKQVLSDTKVIVFGEGPDGATDKENFFVRTELKYQGKGKRFLKPLRWFNLKKVEARIEEAVIQEKIQNIIAVFPDEIFTYAAYKVAKKHNLNFVPWFHNTYLENRSGIDLKMAKKIQSKIFSAENVLVISDGLKDFYTQKYPGVNFQVLRHFLPFPEMNFPLKERGDKIIFFFVGTINDSNLDATRFFCNAIKGHPSIELRISTSVPESVLKGNGVLNENVKYLGFVEDLDKEYENSDFMLLTHGFTGGFSETEYKTIFPTKTVEMLRSNRPIFALSPENTFLSNFLKEKQCCVLTTQKDKGLVITQIEETYNNQEKKLELITNAKESFKLFSLKGAETELTKYLK